MRTKQVRPAKNEFEFEIHLSKQNDRITGKDFLFFDFRTTKTFENFIYRINVTEEIKLDENEIAFYVEGLSAPVNALADHGQAYYHYKLFGFKNTEYYLKIIKQGKEKNNFKIKISKNGLKITKEPPKKFINIIINSD